MRFIFTFILAFSFCFTCQSSDLKLILEKNLETHTLNERNLNSPIFSIQKKHEGLYTKKIKEDLYFVIEHIKLNVKKNKNNQYSYWEEFHKKGSNILYHRGEKLFSKKECSAYNQGIFGFKETLDNYNDSNYRELWIAYAAYEPVVTEASLAYENIEMSFTVTNPKDAPFVSHMGIWRSLHAIIEGKKKHEKISLALHSFAAEVMLHINPQKQYMITVPLKFMRSMFLNELPSSCIFIGDNKFYNEVIEGDKFPENLLSEYDKNLIKNKSKNNDVYNQKVEKKIKKLKDLTQFWLPYLNSNPPRLNWIDHPQYKSRKEIRIMDKGGEDFIFEMTNYSKEDGFSLDFKYSWFLSSRSFCPRSIKLPYIAVDIKVLSQQ